MNKLNKQIAIHIFQQTDFNHLSVVYEETSTEDGQDGWSGFICPRCGVSEESKRINPCVKNYSSNIQLAFQAEAEYQHKGLSLDSYVGNLKLIVDSNPYLVPDEWYLIHANAHQRCQALLKAIGEDI